MAQGVDDALRIARQSRKPTTFEDRLVGAGGTWYWIEWTLVPGPGGDKLTGVGRDVAKAKGRQAALEAAEASLRQAQKMEAVGQLTGGIAHDFNNLLAGISGNLELLRLRLSQGRGSEVERHIGTALRAVKRAASLTHRLLASLDVRPRTEADRREPSGSWLRGVDPAHRRAAGRPGGRGRQRLWTALIDPHRLENAVSNLCINARDALPEGGRLAIETSNRWIDESAAAQRDLTAGQYISLCVSDAGAGMSPEVVERAFDPFFTTKPLGAGTGLGRSMVHGFAQQSNGQVRIYSEVGHGTTSASISRDISARARPTSMRPRPIWNP